MLVEPIGKVILKFRGIPKVLGSINGYLHLNHSVGSVKKSNTLVVELIGLSIKSLINLIIGLNYILLRMTIECGRSECCQIHHFFIIDTLCFIMNM